MIIITLNDFEKKRYELPLEMQINVDNLIIAITSLLISHLLELGMPRQHVMIELDQKTVLVLAIYTTEKKIYLMLADPADLDKQPTSTT